jgi:hypothetical protein
MQLELTEDGQPISAFLRACAGRSIDLSGSGGSPNPLQIIPALWRHLSGSLTKFAAELTSVEASFEPEGDELIQCFRQTIYDAVELFDGYTALLPGRLTPRNAAEKRRLRDYVATVKRRRDFAAKVCNRCKHNGAQLKFLWARSTVNNRTGARILGSSYAEGDALLRDDTLHKGRMAGMGLVRLGQQLGHNLLRVDRAAGGLIDNWPDDGGPPLAMIDAALPVGPALRSLAALRATRHADETAKHDGIVFEENHLGLVRVDAESLGSNVAMRAKLRVEAGTTRYSIA